MEYNWKDISEYRKKEIKEAAELINDVFKGSTSPEYFKGVMDMFNRMIKLPLSLCQPEEIDHINNMVAQEFEEVKLDLLRKAVRE